MPNFRRLLAVTAIAVAPLLAQEVPDQRRLLDDRARPAALAELRHAGAAGAAATVQWLRAAATAGDAAAADRFAETLVVLDSRHIATVTAELVSLLPTQPETRRDALLAALGNGALFADTAGEAALAAALPEWARSGFLYSPAADRATFAWYDYVRLLRRQRCAALGADAAGLHAALQRLLAERQPLAIAFVNRPAGGDDPHALESFGAHGQREELEAIAELAADAEGDLGPVLAELHAYLRHSPPRRPMVLIEHCAGIGETAPADLPAVAFATRWRRDDWRLACARTLLARSQDPDQRVLALRHLLRAGRQHVVLDAIAALRRWPGPVEPFAADLAAVFEDDDRAVVREALATLRQFPELARHATASLDRLRQSKDKELAELAARAIAAPGGDGR